jgi:hypothetical protein
MVLELLFSADLVAILHSLEPLDTYHVPSLAAGHEGASRTSKTSSLRSSATLDSDVPILDLDSPLLETGGLPHFVYHHGSHSSSTSSISYCTCLYVLIPSLQAVTSYDNALLCTSHSLRRQCGRDRSLLR